MVGAGPAGLACATLCAERGHEVHLFEAEKEIGGQFNMAKVIPGKEEYAHTIRYYSTMIKKHGVQLSLNHRVSAEELKAGNFDDIVLATGVTPRKVAFEGSDHRRRLLADGRCGPCSVCPRRHRGCGHTVQAGHLSQDDLSNEVYPRRLSGS